MAPWLWRTGTVAGVAEKANAAELGEHHVLVRDATGSIDLGDLLQHVRADGARAVPVSARTLRNFLSRPGPSPPWLDIQPQCKIGCEDPFVAQAL